MTWLQMCELAECPADFDLMYGLDETRAVYWLRARLISRGHGKISAADIRTALQGRG